jgi:phenylpropionate dioxygenase-like ring-hydroxylating dioxygenase large terminal subunit
MSTTAEELSEPLTIGVEAYVSEDYARAERDKLWAKVWQQVGRVEEIPEVGNYLTYDILDESIVVVRSAADTLRAFYNVCSHRGRRLIDCPKGARNACGHAKKSLVCGFHGWAYDLEGACIHVPEGNDWQGSLTRENTQLNSVKVDTWGGWIWINQDPNCEPLRDYLEPAASMLDPFQLQNQRYRWRRWLIFDCNWKVAMEAFNEIYHLRKTHPEMMAFGDYPGWAKVQGKHSNIGYEAPKGMEETMGKNRLGKGDPRKSTAEMQAYIWKHANTNTTQTLVDAAQRLVDELPEGTPAPAVLKHWLDSAERYDAAHGVIWPKVDPAHVGKSGTAWQIFPNFQIGHAVHNALCYSARPYGYDPNKCIFEVAVYGLFPEGQAPKTEWIFTQQDDPAWGSVLPQDFSNMAAVQQGLRSRGFRGTQPNPYRERSTANLHRMLARYMGSGAPRPLK